MWPNAQNHILQVTRRLTEMQVRCLRHALVLLDGKPDRTPFFALAIRMAADNWFDAHGPKSKSEATVITVNSTAASLRMPFETTRRHLNALATEGLLFREDGRLYFAPAEERRDHVATYARRICEEFLDLVLKIRSDGVILHDEGGPDLNEIDRLNFSILLKGTLDALLIPFEHNRVNHSNWYQLMLYGCYNMLNVEHVTNSPMLAKKYGTEPVPDEMRTPIPPYALANWLRLPYPTVRRQTNGIVEAGLAERWKSGIVVPCGAIRVTIPAAEQNAKYLFKVIARSLQNLDG